jgi:hypothetical protein
MAAKVNVIFDVLHDKRKHFQKYVRSKFKEELQSIIRMETCQEIKKLFAPWHILDIMDCSQQSLNQVSYVSYVLAFHSLICDSLRSFFLLGMLQSNLWNKKNLSQNGLRYYQKSNKLDQHRSSLMLTCTR